MGVGILFSRILVLVILVPDVWCLRLVSLVRWDVLSVLCFVLYFFGSLHLFWTGKHQILAGRARICFLATAALGTCGFRP